jgi:hypothetical protein
MLRPTVSQRVCLGVKHPSGTKDQIFITVRALRVCWCGSPSLRRGQVCRLQFLLVLASAVILGSGSSWTYDYILLSQIRDFPNLEGQVPLFIYPRNKVAKLCPQALGSIFIASYDSQGYGGGIRTCLHVGNQQLKSQSYFTTGGLPPISSSQSQSQSYFTTAGLPPISSSWRQSLETHDQRFFSNWTLLR